MATKIYGQSDDLIEVDGDVRGEVGCYGTDENKHPGVLLTCSDGTVLAVKYGKASMAIWQIVVHRQGDLFDRIDACMDEDANPYSDVAHFKDGLKWVMASTAWQRVR